MGGFLVYLPPSQSSETKQTKKQAIRPSLPLIRFPRFAQSSGLLRRGYYPCHSLNSKKSISNLIIHILSINFYIASVKRFFASFPQSV